MARRNRNTTPTTNPGFDPANSNNPGLDSRYQSQGGFNPNDYSSSTVATNNYDFAGAAANNLPSYTADYDYDGQSQFQQDYNAQQALSAGGQSADMTAGYGGFFDVPGIRDSIYETFKDGGGEDVSDSQREAHVAYGYNMFAICV